MKINSISNITPVKISFKTKVLAKAENAIMKACSFVPDVKPRVEKGHIGILGVLLEEALNLKHRYVVKESSNDKDMLNKTLSDATSKFNVDVYKDFQRSVHEMKPIGFYENKKDGFRAITYSDGADIVLCYSGTNNFTDIFADFQMMIGKVPNQYKDAEEIYQQLRRRNPDKDILLTGHSLGGSLAQLVASKHKDVSAITYNAFGTQRIIKNSENVFKDNHNCFNYVTDGDFVSNCQKHVGKTVAMQSDFPEKHRIAFYEDLWA